MMVVTRAAWLIEYTNTVGSVTVGLALCQCVCTLAPAQSKESTKKNGNFHLKTYTHIWRVDALCTLNHRMTILVNYNNKHKRHVDLKVAAEKRTEISLIFFYMCMWNIFFFYNKHREMPHIYIIWYHRSCDVYKNWGSKGKSAKNVFPKKCFWEKKL